jgi:large subunit ribosomal protein L13
MAKEMIIDAEDSVLGRVAAYAAKKALLGNKIIVVNCEKAVITGDKQMIKERFLIKISRGGSAQKGPYHSRNPALIVKRAIRGMLPYKKARGMTAFKNIKCYNGIPLDCISAEKETIKKPLNVKYIHLSELKQLI